MIEKSCKWLGQGPKALLRLGLLSIVFLLSECGLSTQLAQTNVELRNAVTSFDRAINSLARQSADWQVVLQELEEELVDDIQSTTRVELNNLMRTGLLGMGGEFRCDAEFLRIRMQRELRRIRNEFVRNLNIEGLHIPLLPEIPAEPYICSAVPAAVDLSLDEERRAMLDVYGFDLLSKPITAEVVSVNGRRRNVTGSLAIISNQQMVLNLTQSGAALEEDSRKIVFSWGRTPLRFTGSLAVLSDEPMALDLAQPSAVIEAEPMALDLAQPSAVIEAEFRPIVSPWYGPQCVIPILNPAITIECDTRTELVTASSETYTPPHTRGDKEFKGHGPCVQFGLNLVVDPERTSLKAVYWIDAWECPDDYCCWEGDKTQADGSGAVILFQVASPDERILGYDLENSFYHEYIDNDHTDDLFTFGGISPVEKLIYVGDTKGNDVYETQVTIYFREMRVNVEKCESR